MRILQVITLSNLGGAQSVVANLSNELTARGHDVIVAAGEGDGALISLLDKRIATERIPSLVRRLSPVNELKAIMAMKRLYRKYRPDIIHLHSSKAGILGRLAFPKSKIVYTVHGFDSVRIAYRKFLPVERLLRKRCRAIVGVSRYDETNLRNEGITHNVTTVYNGIGTPVRSDGDLFAGLRKYKKTVLAIARLSPQKDHNLFIEIARRLPDYAFVWIGNQETPAGSWPGNVCWMGPVLNASALIGHADLFLLTSNYEGLPMVIIEALASGVPVVSSKVGGVTELLDGSNGIAVDNDADKMARAVKSILTLPEAKYRAMQQAAREAYLRSFTVQSMTDGYLDIYRRITAG